MKYYKDNDNSIYAYESDGSQDAFIKPDLTQITAAEVEQIRLASIPQPTFAELAENVRVALQSAIDDKAKSFGFSDGNALMLYAGKDNPFRALADVFFLWEANVWAEAGAYKAEVIAGTKPMLTPDEAVAMMPTYPA